MPARRLPAFEPGEHFYTVDAGHRLLEWVVRADGMLVIVPTRPWERADQTALMKAGTYSRGT